jgi:uncharacterized protein (TIRG00374 family)
MKIREPGEARAEARPGRALVRNMLPLALLLAAFLLVALHTGPADTWAAIGSVSLPTLALMLAASAFNYAARSVRWFLMFRLVAPRAPESALRAMPRQLVVYLAGFAFTLTPGRAGEVIRAWIARKSFDTPVATGLSLVIADRFYDAIALAIILLAAASMLGSFSVAAGITMAVLAAAVLIAAWLSSPSGLWRRAANAVPKLSRHVMGLQSAIAQFSFVSRPQMLPLLTLPSLAGWGVQGLAPAIVLRDMGFALGIRDSVLVFALATLVGGASFLPGGLGGFEATMIALLVAKGVPIATAVAATLLVRFTTLWLGVALGIAMLAVWSYAGRDRHGAD